eukprot:scaffold31652_cov59-Phaeocystis_antarctica.AAC.2
MQPILYPNCSRILPLSLTLQIDTAQPSQTPIPTYHPTLYLNRSPTPPPFLSIFSLEIGATSKSRDQTVAAARLCLRLRCLRPRLRRHRPRLDFRYRRLRGAC